MNNQPIDKGRICVIAERYQSNQVDQQGQPIMKNRYATVGRCTLWPGENGGQPRMEAELDTIPLGSTGPVKLYFFMDSESNNQQSQQNSPQGGYQGGHQQSGYQNGYPQR